MPDRKRLEVRRVGRLNFDVTSETDPTLTYAVDFDDPQFPRGHCTCDDFKFRIEHYIEHGEPPSKMCCKHIESAILSVYGDYQTNLVSGLRRARFNKANHRSRGDV